MLENYLLVPADRSAKCRSVLCESNHLLTSMQKYIYSDSVECCYRQYRLHTLVLCIDGVGKICDPSKPLNVRASVLYANPFDHICGDVLIGCIGLRNGEADVVPLPDYLHTELSEFFDSII